MPEESELIEQWQRGVPGAGEQLVQLHFEALLRFVRSKIDDRTAVDDIVQETWTALLVQRERVVVKTTLRHYLLGIATHKIFKFLRLRINAREVELPTMSIEQLAPSLGGAVDAKVQHKLLIMALRSLPLEQQVMLELYVWESMHAKDIAELLGLTVAQIRHRLRDGRQQLARFARSGEHRNAAHAAGTQELVSWMNALQAFALPSPNNPEPTP